jgi:hypothetical protein
MPGRYDAETRMKVVRLFRNHVADYDSPWAAMKAISGAFGDDGRDTSGVQQDEVDAVRRPGAVDRVGAGASGAAA